MRILPADTIMCASKALFHVKLLVWPPVHHNLIRLHIFPPLLQRSPSPTPELISNEDLPFSSCAPKTHHLSRLWLMHRYATWSYCTCTVKIPRSLSPFPPPIWERISQTIRECDCRRTTFSSALVSSLVSLRTLVLLSWLYEDSLY